MATKKILIKNIINQGIQFFYPSWCLGCDISLTYASIFCSLCYSAIQPRASHILSLTKYRSMVVHCLGAYQDHLKTVILKKNVSDRQASRGLAHLMVDMIKSRNIDVDLVVPISLHWTRYAYRGYNQANILATIIAQELGLVQSSVLIRHVRTPFQSLFNKKQREENMHGVFRLKRGYQDTIKGKRILLVDDVCTTGATLKSAARLLLKAHPASVTACVAAS